MVTTSRADYGIYRPLLRRLQAEAQVELQLLVSGSHLGGAAAATVEEVTVSSISITRAVPIPEAPDSVGVGRAIAAAVDGFAEAYDSLQPDLVVVLGDRYEMHAAGLAALPFRLPVAHIHGGELSEGAFDDALRHSLTKLSHLHFVATEEYRRRVVQLGEEPWRVTVSGAPSLDNLVEGAVASPGEVAAELGLDASSPPIAVAFHPSTLDEADPAEQVRGMVEALIAADLPLVITAPNADPGSAVIEAELRRLAEASGGRFVASLGSRLFLGLLGWAKALVGNSSAGIVEAASFGLPVVNVGLRQSGRVRGPNVIDCGSSSTEVQIALRRAVDPGFASSLADVGNPYFAGGAAEMICSRLQDVRLDARLIRKRFHDLDCDHLR